MLAEKTATMKIRCDLTSPFVSSEKSSSSQNYQSLEESLVFLFSFFSSVSAPLSDRAPLRGQDHGRVYE
jgi:hypothetical protein